MNTPIALVYHLNLDHINLTREQSNRLIMKDLELMLTGIKSPVNISSTARDWQLLAEVNPRALRSIRENPNITVLRGPFSHALIGQFPKVLRQQLGYGNDVHENLFGSDMTPYGFVPEFAFDSSFLGVVNEYWTGHVASGAASEFMRINPDANTCQENRTSVTHLGAVRVLTERGTDATVNIAERKNVGVRFNKYFRGLNEPHHVMDSLVRTAASTQAPFTVYVQDFETPVINKALFEGKKYERLDCWFELVEEFNKNANTFIPLDEQALLTAQEFAANNCQYLMLPREKDKWLAGTHAHDIMRKIQAVSTNIGALTPYEQLIVLQTMSSDAFVLLSDDRPRPPELRGRIKLPNQIDYAMVPSIFNEYDPMRYVETIYLLDCLERGQPIVHESPAINPALKQHLEWLDKSIRTIASRQPTPG